MYTKVKWHINMILGLSCLVWLNACKKAIQPNHGSRPPKQQIQSMLNNQEENLIIRNETTTGLTDDYKTALLGRRYNNPFTVNNIKNAWNALSSNQLTTLAPTHYYVKFSPTTLTQYKLLIESGYHLSTLPFDYEIIEWGDYLSDQSTFHNGIPEYFSVIPENQTIPEVPHTILDALYLTRFEDIVTEKAFELAGETENYVYDRGEEPHAEFDQINPGQIMPVKDLETEWSSGWHYTAPEENTGGTLPPTGTGAPFCEVLPLELPNTCNCDLNSDSRKPSGCIVVEETQFAQINHKWQGVNDVMIEFFGPFFQYTHAQTLANGCFKCNKTIHHKITKKKKLPVFGRIIFISPRKTIKGLRADNLISYAMPCADDIGNVTSSGQSLNNVHVEYHHSTPLTSLATLYYTTCHANNSIYEISSYANEDGIHQPPNGIHIIMNKKTNASAAPMIRKLLLSGSPASIITMGTFVNFLNFTPIVGTWGIQQVLASFPPDISFGYAWTNPGDFNSDQMRGLYYYHELGHSIHYSKTSTSFWNTLVLAEGSNGSNPYGNSMGENHAPQIALCEMWAVHCGYRYAHRRYGPNRHSLNTNPTLFHSWYGEEELIDFMGSYIPYGLLGDLMDDNQYNTTVPSPILVEPFFVENKDSVNGFSQKQLFDELGPNTNDIYNYFDNIKYNQLPNTGAQNTLPLYLKLLNAYGL